MPRTTHSLTSREFNQDTAGAKKATLSGPVFITDRGRPAHVLLSMSDYLKLVGGPVSLRAALVPAEEMAHAEIAFDPPRLGSGLLRPADLS